MAVLALKLLLEISLIIYLVIMFSSFCTQKMLHYRYHESDFNEQEACKAVSLQRGEWLHLIKSNSKIIGSGSIFKDSSASTFHLLIYYISLERY